ncbi:hypothetical protein TNCV_1304151 [Trichonephila clavipes]|nr:hypothetical protein TNCV_1304151 [Trichonephila clavipes]
MFSRKLTVDRTPGVNTRYTLIASAPVCYKRHTSKKSGSRNELTGRKLPCVKSSIPEVGNEQESLHQVHLTFPRNSLTHQALLFIQLSQGNAPAVQKMSRRSKERAGTGSKTGKQLPKVEIPRENFWRRPGPTQGSRSIEEEEEEAIQ